MLALISLDSRCARCHRSFEIFASPNIPGYGITEAGEKLCYKCCGDDDREWMRTHDRITLYLTITHTPATDAQKRSGYGAIRTYEVTNWPGTLRFKAFGRKGYHNIARTRYDVWFTDDTGKKWYGVQYGDNTQILHCRALKR